MIYAINYDLKQPGQNYNELYEAIKSCGAWWHYLDSTWLVDTSLTAQGIWNKLFIPPLFRASRVEEAALADIPKAVASAAGADTPIRRRLPETWTHGSVVVLVTLMLAIYLALNLLF